MIYQYKNMTYQYIVDLEHYEVIIWSDDFKNEKDFWDYIKPIVKSIREFRLINLFDNKHFIQFKVNPK